MSSGRSTCLLCRADPVSARLCGLVSSRSADTALDVPNLEETGGILIGTA